MTLLIVLASVAVYLGGWLWTARRRYAMTRPYTEPLSCPVAKYEHEPWNHHEHNRDCYTRPEFSLTESANQAALFAAAWAIGWPVILAGLGIWSLLGRAIVAGDREDPAELRAQIARLERELGQKP